MLESNAEEYIKVMRIVLPKPLMLALIGVLDGDSLILQHVVNGDSVGGTCPRHA